MKFRLTPLNIVTALGFATFIFIILKPEQFTNVHVDLKGYYLLILGCLIVVTFVTDMIFRFTLKDLKKIWLVEAVFIVLTAVLIVLLQK